MALGSYKVDALPIWNGNTQLNAPATRAAGSGVTYYRVPAANFPAGEYVTLYAKVHYNQSTLDDTFFALTPVRTKSQTTGIDTTPWDMSQPRHYFDLQGRPVTSPRSGYLYIERQGSTARKVRL